MTTLLILVCAIAWILMLIEWRQIPIKRRDIAVLNRRLEELRSRRR